MARTKPKSPGRRALGPARGEGRITITHDAAAVAFCALTQGGVQVAAAAPAPVAAPVAAEGTAPESASTPPARARVVAGGLLIRDVRETWPPLREAVANAITEIDVSGVRAIDSAGVQLLLVLVMEARRREQPLKFTGHCTALDEAVGCLGLQSAFATARELTAS